MLHYELCVFDLAENIISLQQYLKVVSSWVYLITPKGHFLSLKHWVFKKKSLIIFKLMRTWAFVIIKYYLRHLNVWERGEGCRGIFIMFLSECSLQSRTRRVFHICKFSCAVEATEKLEDFFFLFYSEVFGQRSDRSRSNSKVILFWS